MKKKEFTWYTCKVQVANPTAENEQNKVTESYVVDAVNFTDAETKIVKLLGSEVMPFEIKRIVKSNFEGVLDETRFDTYYKVKAISRITNDNGKEKTTNHFFLVKDVDLVNAINRVKKEELSQWLIETEVVAATLTDIVNVITE